MEQLVSEGKKSRLRLERNVLSEINSRQLATVSGQFYI